MNSRFMGYAKLLAFSLVVLIDSGRVRAEVTTHKGSSKITVTIENGKLIDVINYVEAVHAYSIRIVSEPESGVFAIDVDDLVRAADLDKVRGKLTNPRKYAGSEILLKRNVHALTNEELEKRRKAKAAKS